MDWDERLRAMGVRSTPARRAVLTVIEATSAHLSGDEIAVAVEEQVPDVHRATVFRTLERLVALGVVAHVHMPHGAATYHLRDEVRRMHLHLLCRKCGQVFDVDSRLLDHVASGLHDTLGFALDTDHAALSGVCHRCQVAEERSTASMERGP